MSYACVLALSLLAGPASFPDTALEPARAQARAANRLVLAEFWTFNTDLSRSYRRKTLSRPVVMSWLEEHAVGARVNADFNRTLRERFHVKELPTLLLLDADLTLWGRVTGPARPDDVAAALEAALADRAAFLQAQAVLEAEPANVSALAALTRGFIRREDAKAAEASLDRLRAADPQGTAARHEELAFAIAAEILEPHGDAAGAIRLFADSAEWARRGNAEIRQKALFRLANLKLFEGQPEAAAKILELLLEEFERFPDRSKALYVLGLMYVRELGQREKGSAILRKVRDSYADRFSSAAGKLLEALEAR